jgi:hypothetical protein
MPCDYPTDKAKVLAILDAAASAGMTVLVRDDARMPSSITGDPDAKAKLDSLLADYAWHPGYGGLRVHDEPARTELDGFAEVVQYLRAKDPKHLAFVNLNPLFVYPGGETAYEEYVDAWARLAHPQVLSYDDYPFLLDGTDRPEWLPNLAIVRRVALRYGIPFWQIVLAVPHGPYRSPTAAEKRWEAMQTLAHGGSGLAWFTYWTRTDQPGFGLALIDKDGTRSPQYEEVRAIDADLTLLARHLAGARSVDVSEQRSGACDLTFGAFDDGSTLVANRDHAHACTTDLAWPRDALQLDRATDRWVVRGMRASVTIEAGDAVLFRPR